MGPKLDGKYGSTSCPYLRFFGFSNRNIRLKGVMTLVKSLGKEEKNTIIVKTESEPAVCFVNLLDCGSYVKFRKCF